jgi:hypothetical protein
MHPLSLGRTGLPAITQKVFTVEITFAHVTCARNSISIILGPSITLPIEVPPETVSELNCKFLRGHISLDVIAFSTR